MGSQAQPAPTQVPANGEPSSRSLDHPASNRGIEILALLSLVAAYALMLWGGKLWAFPGWTWIGFLTSFESLSKTLLGTAAFVGVVLPFYLKRTEQLRLIGVARKAYQRHLLTVLSLTALAIVAFSVSILIFGERDFTKAIRARVRNGDWEAARGLVAEMRKKPYRPEVLKTLDAYVTTSGQEASDSVIDAQSLRERRSSVESLLGANIDPHSLNTITFCILSRLLYDVEKNTDVLAPAEAKLSATIPAQEGDQPELLGQLGQLQLAKKQYDSARAAFLKAQAVETDPAQRALWHMYVGNTYAAAGNLQQAITIYHEAERDFPEGRRYIFYSNLSYLEFLASDFSDALIQAKRAIAIKSDDWYSYLNEGLIYDAMGEASDAQATFEKVSKESKNRDARQEAFVLQGYSAEKSGRSPNIFIASYLKAEEKVANQAAVQQILDNPAAKQNLYRAMAADLEHGRTHGTEQIAHWFRQKAIPRHA